MSNPFRKWALAALALMAVALGAYGFAPAGRHVDKPDLSTPERAMAALVSALKDSDTEALNLVATKTGISSLIALYTHEDFKEGLTVLGRDLEQATTTWDPITDDIFVAKATHEAHTHKMEFTREEPGWMLYHWQLGGGVK